MNIMISKVVLSDIDGRVKVHIRIDGEEDERILSLHWDLPIVTNVTEGEITPEFFDELEHLHRVSLAISAALSIVSYASCSHRALGDKLRKKGFSREVCEHAVSYISDKGYIDEEGGALREAERAVSKLWGRKRIVAALHQKGYSDDSLSEVYDYFEQVDFEENCQKVLRKKTKAAPNTRTELSRLYAYLSRYGYGSLEIRTALRALRDAELEQ